jgi:gluconate kinase
LYQITRWESLVVQQNLEIRYQKTFYYEIKAIHRRADYDEHMRRLENRPGKTIPKHVLLSMQANFQVPTEAEGFEIVQLFNIWGDDYYSYI